jgi:hypothetical protein
VAAVAAVKAALAGFGTKGWQQQVRGGHDVLRVIYYSSSLCRALHRHHSVLCMGLVARFAASAVLS